MTSPLRNVARRPRRPGRIPPGAARIQLRRDARGLCADGTSLLLRVHPVAQAGLELRLVLPLARAVGEEDQVELEILGVVPVSGAAERLLEVHVPAREPPLRAGPEMPDRVQLAG